MHSTCLVTGGNISMQDKGEFSVALKYIIRGDAQSRDWATAEGKNARAIHCKCGSLRQNSFFLQTAVFEPSYSLILTNMYGTIM